jgi:hypothetical protein
LHDLSYGCRDHIRDWPVSRREADFDLIDGFRLSTTGGDRTRYIFVKLLGEAVWRNKPKDELMVEWLQAVRDDKIMEFIREVTGGKRREIKTPDLLHPRLRGM